MTRPHLRVVSSQDGPVPVEQMETFSFARVGGELIVLHNDDRVTVPVALVEIMQLVTPFLSPNRAGGEEVLTRRVFPGEMGGGLDIPVELLSIHPPCAMMHADTPRDTLRDVHTRPDGRAPAGDGG